jgi:hypothetical protein
MIDEEPIWAMGFAICQDRGRGDPSPCLDAIAPHCLGWPPVMAEPLAHSKFKTDAVSQAALMGEAPAARLRGLSVNRDTALCCFSTHRTLLGEGLAQGDARIADDACNKSLTLLR